MSVNAFKLSALTERGDLAFCDPIVVTRDRVVIDGYARLEFAKRKRLATLNCVERDLTSEEAPCYEPLRIWAVKIVIPLGFRRFSQKWSYHYGSWDKLADVHAYSRASVSSESLQGLL